MENTIPIAKVELTDAEIQSVVKVLKSGVLSQGPLTKEFEKAFANKMGAKHAIAVSSGTAALHIAYLSVLEEGDEVLVPSFSHISTASMVCFSRCKPVFCDISPDTYSINIDDAKKRITNKTKAIAPVHIFGNACDIDGIMDFAKDHSLLSIWDASQAHGTMYKGKDIGSFDDIVCYSFYATKNIFTGEGGMITTNNEEVANKCRLLRSHWQTSKYLHPGIGLNYRMSEVEAAIGLEQLKKLDQLVQLRRKNAAYLTSELSEIDGIVLPFVNVNVKHSYHQYAILLDLKRLSSTRDEFTEALKKLGIGTGIHYPRPLHKQPAFESIVGNMSLPVSEDVCNRIISLPVYPQLNNDDLVRIVKAIRITTSKSLIAS
ncbi:DegT/DnrJ/EryC1/StrS family aminotransferase [Chloroflexota bacterium]